MIPNLSKRACHNMVAMETSHVMNKHLSIMRFFGVSTANGRPYCFFQGLTSAGNLRTRLRNFWLLLVYCVYCILTRDLSLVILTIIYLHAL